MLQFWIKKMALKTRQIPRVTISQSHNKGNIVLFFH